MIVGSVAVGLAYLQEGVAGDQPLVLAIEEFTVVQLSSRVIFNSTTSVPTGATSVSAFIRYTSAGGEVTVKRASLVRGHYKVLEFTPSRRDAREVGEGGVAFTTANLALNEGMGVSVQFGARKLPLNTPEITLVSDRSINAAGLSITATQDGAIFSTVAATAGSTTLDLTWAARVPYQGTIQ